MDAKRGRFYTNMEEKDLTLAIDLRTRKTIATWHPNCGKEGPHGNGLDVPAGHLVIACCALAEVYAGVARATKLTIARVDEKATSLSSLGRPPRERTQRHGYQRRNRLFSAQRWSKLNALAVVSPQKK